MHLIGMSFEPFYQFECRFGYSEQSAERFRRFPQSADRLPASPADLSLTALRILPTEIQLFPSFHINLGPVLPAGYTIT